MVIRLSHSSSYKLKFSVGFGTNTKSELLALWVLLYFAKEKEISLTMILGNSKLIIDWAKRINEIHLLELHHWIRRTRHLINHFQQTNFCHIYRELNSDADSLSKHAIGA